MWSDRSKMNERMNKISCYCRIMQQAAALLSDFAQFQTLSQHLLTNQISELNSGVLNVSHVKSKLKRELEYIKIWNESQNNFSIPSELLTVMICESHMNNFLWNCFCDESHHPVRKKTSHTDIHTLWLRRMIFHRRRKQTWFCLEKKL